MAVGDVMRRDGAELRLGLAPGKSLKVPFEAEGVSVTYQRRLSTGSGTRVFCRGLATCTGTGMRL